MPCVGEKDILALGRHQDEPNPKIDIQVVRENSTTHGHPTMGSFTANAVANQWVQMVASVSPAICLGQRTGE